MLSFMFSKCRPPHVLNLMLIKHGNKEVGPSSHSVSYKIKLLQLYTRALSRVLGFTHVTVTRFGPVSPYNRGNYNNSRSQQLVLITLMKVSMNSMRASGGKSSGIVTSTSQPLGILLYRWKEEITHTHHTCTFQRLRTIIITIVFWTTNHSQVLKLIWCSTIIQNLRGKHLIAKPEPCKRQTPSWTSLGA